MDVVRLPCPVVSEILSMLDTRGRFLKRLKALNYIDAFLRSKDSELVTVQRTNSPASCRGITAEGAEIIERTNGLYKPL